MFVYIIKFIIDFILTKNNIEFDINMSIKFTLKTFKKLNYNEYYYINILNDFLAKIVISRFHQKS